MYLVLLFILLIVLILFEAYNKPADNNIEGFYYYPNCMETAFGGSRCYPYYNYPYRRYYYPLYPWSYYW